MIPQLPLALRWPRRQRFEHFHPGANAAALAAARMLAETPGAPWIYLHGPAGAGRSHLLLAACQAASAAGRRAQYLPLAAIADRAAAIRGVAGGELLALDDLGAIAGDRAAEHALFDLYNQTRAEGGALLFAADAPPAQLGLELPDLRSRLGACTQFALKPLDDAERREVLRAQAAARGIELDDAVLDWLFARYARDMGALLDLLDRLDQASLAAQRRVTVPFLREWLRGAGP
ncbi:DnaA regulatory inactivator Hda [Fulvimonas soli]|jgi:DnaA family protein|uniref:Regulatory inactivation of DnaA Hda protein n=1 Tax=Fulvimonas soli TaxID=155197 RepID=A0A316HNH0_9GAMM|nr:DnaA regulatory inactivator Hda [Fulvimonas soli]PWK81574.1 regulatory inactivation of DnaA Hda protein [Fulvimonas soli]TNY25293.1 DnaA regulatory inactivator Hda [Fulvimonas soli]